MYSVLLIEDEPEIADILKSAIEGSIESVKCEIETNFAESSSRIAQCSPDAVVLDLMEGRQSANLPGERTWQSIWQDVFCPIVIYTGSDADLNPPVPAHHPFVKRIQKGSGTQSMVVDAIRGFLPAVEAVRLLREESNAVILRVLRDTAGAGHIPAENKSLLLHVARRRIAATMDDRTVADDRLMECWEHYLIPALGTDCLTGDILHKRGTAKLVAENYRLMLSPSCDLARRARNLQGALVARCHAPAAMLEKFSSAVKTNDQKDLKRQLMSLVLSQGAWNGWFPLPGFPDTIPEMVANIKDVEVLPREALHPEGAAQTAFDRVASIDSPFREQVAWAFLTTAARPGMPDRELKSWADAIMRANMSPSNDNSSAR